MHVDLYVYQGVRVQCNLWGIVFIYLSFEPHTAILHVDILVDVVIYMCVCMYVCMSVCMYVCMSVCMYVSV